jgi:hypothetical protein
MAKDWKGSGLGLFLSINETESEVGTAFFFHGGKATGGVKLICVYFRVIPFPLPHDFDDLYAVSFVVVNGRERCERVCWCDSYKRKRAEALLAYGFRA